MTHTRKSFALSLAFHTLMGSMAFWVLTQTSTPPNVTRIPFKIMSFQPSEHRVAIPLPKTRSVSETQPHSEMIPTPVHPVMSKPAITQTPPPAPLPIATQPSPTQTSTPIAIAAPKTLSTPQPVSTPAPLAVAKPEVKPDTASEKRALLASLRSTIQNNLRYPSAARRRGMEGEVGVRFTLSDNGSIGSISVQNGDSIFHNAAKAAVSSASGINIPKNLTDSLPMEIELTLEFRLTS